MDVSSAFFRRRGGWLEAYSGRQYYYDQLYSGAAPEAVPVPWLDPTLSMQEHATFPNLLASIQRGSLLDVSAFNDDMTVYGGTFPAATARSAIQQDIIVKYRYDRFASSARAGPIPGTPRARIRTLWKAAPTRRISR